MKKNNAPCILVIDDNSDIREVLVFLFQSEGYVTFQAKHGVEAIELLKNNKTCDPDIILVDLNMPVMNGRDFIHEKIRLGLAKKSDVIVFAATNEKEELPQISDWIKKPIDLDFLLTNISKVFEKRKKRVGTELAVS